MYEPSLHQRLKKDCPTLLTRLHWSNVEESCRNDKLRLILDSM